MAGPSLGVRVTAARLAVPLSGDVYAMRAGRIRFIPFQYRPLMRLLRSDRPRLLIADEVGVGKTIEAGLILQEYSSRQAMDRVLVACPRALTDKWRAEMARFDEDFRILDAAALRYCIEETHADGAWPAEFSRAIVNYELARGDALLGRPRVGRRGGRSGRGLLDLDPPPRFDLVIADEAHHLRNPETATHELGRFLADCSDALLLLSATPVQLSTSDLFVLLHLLRPDLFPDEDAFAQVVRPNRWIIQAARELRARSSPGWQARAAAALSQAADCTWGRQELAGEASYEASRRRLEDPSPLADAERVRLLRDVEELHTLSTVMNRTRRRDIDWSTLREPHTVSIEFTAEQRHLYDAVVAWRRRTLRDRYPEPLVRMISDTLERQASSCLPALASALRDLLDPARPGWAAVTDDPDGPADPGGRAAEPVLDAEAARVLDLAARLSGDDPKLNALLEVIDGARRSPGSGKVLVFSFFLHTLGYLRAALERAGVRVGLVTGAVPEEERHALRARFRLPPARVEALDVLLSSDVGCEGLDYEFCDRLVNYDIPWNPMRLEQRIGRLDRHGQQSPKVLVYNLITPGTVEERVFYRCYERLGLFGSCVGDLEGVLGDLTSRLHSLASSVDLTPEQAAQQADRLADGVARWAAESRALEESSGQLLALPGAEPAVEALAEGRFVSGADLVELVRAWVTSEPLRGALTDAGQPGLVRLALGPDARARLLADLPSRPGRAGADRRLRRWLASDEPLLDLAIDQALAESDRSLDHLTPAHPLTRMAARHLAPGPSTPLTREHLALDADAPAGSYVFAIDLWRETGVRPHARLAATVLAATTGLPADDVAATLLQGLSAAIPGRVPPAGIDDGTWDRLDHEAEARRLAAEAEATRRNDALVRQQLAALDGQYQRRSQRLADQARDASDPRIHRMRVAEQGRATGQYEDSRLLLESRTPADIASHRLAEGTLVIRHAQ